MQYLLMHHSIWSNTSKLDIQLLFNINSQRKIMKKCQKMKIFKVHRNNLEASKTHLGCL